MIDTKSSNVTSTPKIYDRNEVLKSSIEYFKGDNLAADAWINKYCLKDLSGNLYELNPNFMHKRIAKELARIEKKYPNPLSECEIFDLIKNFKYLVPQGSPMAGMGNNYQIVSLSSCFVIGNEELGDSYGGIMKLDQELVHLEKRRGGVGIDLSFIRPDKSLVNNAALTSTGVVLYMERYSNSTREVAQGGRRGALMESISIKHPDAEIFIDAKMIKGKVTGANISVRIDDKFMNAAIAGSDYTQQYPIEADNPDITIKIDANKLWNKIIHNAWKSAEPGILFWDTIIRESIPDCYADQGFKTTSTNPCAELPLCNSDTCRLLAINLYSYVENPFETKSYFDYGLFKKHVYYAQRLMDDIIDLEIEKINKIIEKIENDPESIELKQIELNLWMRIKAKCAKGRRTGLGVTAEGDMLAALNITYGTAKSNIFSENIHKQLKLEAYRSSVDMAKERGPFEIWDEYKEQSNPFLLRLKRQDAELYRKMQYYGRRNIALLTIAPTGTVSLMTQTTSGIEPAFMILYMRRKKINPNDKDVRVDFIDESGDAWQEYSVFHHKFEKWLEVKGYDIDNVKSWEIKDIDILIKQSPYHEATSRDVNWIKKVEMQGLIQKHVDHSISVTVNLPNDVTEETVRKVYETGWQTGCKGITVYRDGSRDGILIDTKEKQEQLFKDNNAPKRPKRLKANILRFQNNLEKWIAFVGLYDNRPYEIFTGRVEETSFNIPLGIENGFIIKRKDESGNSVYDFEYVDKNGDTQTLQYLSKEFNKEYWNYAKLISSVLRHGMPIVYVNDLIQSLNLDSSHLNTWKNGIARVLKKYIPNGTGNRKAKCEECKGTNLQYMEGCLICKDCGSSVCG